MWILRLDELFFGPFTTEEQAEKYLKLCSAEESEIIEVIPASCPDCMAPMDKCKNRNEVIV